MSTMAKTCICGHQEEVHCIDRQTSETTGGCLLAGCDCETFDDEAKYFYMVVREYRGNRRSLLLGNKKDAEERYRREALEAHSGNLQIWRVLPDVAAASSFGYNRTRW
jgi:hypothetical protein